MTTDDDSVFTIASQRRVIPHPDQNRFKDAFPNPLCLSDRCQQSRNMTGRDFQFIRPMTRQGRGQGSFLRLHERTDKSGNFIRCRVQREMTTIDNMDLRIGHISPVGFRLRGVKR